METIIKDIDIVIEAIKNGDSDDAIKMLVDIQEDLRLFVLMH